MSVFIFLFSVSPLNHMKQFSLSIERCFGIEFGLWTSVTELVFALRPLLVMEESKNSWEISRGGAC